MERLISLVKRRVATLSARHILPGMVSQMFLSIASFVVGLAVARFSPKAEYGIYFIAFSLIGIFSSFQNALANTPMTVLLRERPEDERASFVTAVAASQVLVFIPIIVLATLAVTIVPAFRDALHGFSRIAWLVALGASSWLAREFMRTLRLTNLRMSSVVAMDAVSAVVTILGVWWALHNAGLGASSAVMAISVGCLAGAAIGYWLPGRKFNFRTPIRRTTISALRESWPYAKWALIGVAAGLLQTRAYVFVSTSDLGLSGLANVAASRMLLMPVGVLVASTVRVVIAKGSEIKYEGNERSVARFGVSVALLLVVSWGAYVGLLAMFYPHVVALLGPKYGGIAPLVRLWAVYFLLESLRYPILNTLVAIKEFRIVTRNDIIAGAVTVVGCLVLGHLAGEAGVIVALCAGELLLLVLSATELSRVVKKTDRREEALPPAAAARSEVHTGARLPVGTTEEE